MVAPIPLGVTVVRPSSEMDSCNNTIVQFLAAILFCQATRKEDGNHLEGFYGHFAVPRSSRVPVDLCEVVPSLAEQKDHPG